MLTTHGGSDGFVHSKRLHTQRPDNSVLWVAVENSFNCTFIIMLDHEEGISLFREVTNVTLFVIMLSPFSSGVLPLNYNQSTGLFSNPGLKTSSLGNLGSIYRCPCFTYSLYRD